MTPPGFREKARQLLKHGWETTPREQQINLLVWLNHVLGQRIHRYILGGESRPRAELEIWFSI